jgi:2-polyprenyl-3-methyl-5-hydroxy-6-metoxy-1,4-benzoquinol methylase
MGQSSISPEQTIESQEESQDRAMPEAASKSKCPLCGGAQIVSFMTTSDRFHWQAEQYDLMRCSGCSYVLLADPPKPEEMGPHYSEDYHRVIMAAGELSAPSRWGRQCDMIARHKQGGAILDIGCSSGGFLRAMKGGAWKLHGIEWEASTAEKAKAATGAEIFVGEALDAPFADESFDVITGFDLVEHVYHPRQFLAKVQQWLKPGGIVYLGIPNIDSWEARMLGTYWYGLELPRHLSHFSPKSLRHVMASLGFEEVSLITPPTSYIEHSAAYIRSEIIKTVGGSPVPMSKRGPRSLPWRAVRKGLQLSLVVPFSQVASMAGAGPSIEAVFRKRGSNPEKTSGVSGSKA